MHKAIIRNWNTVVGKDDEVWIAGDWSLKKGQHKQQMAQILNALHGTKHLIYGNHDQMLPMDYIDMGFQTVHYPLIQLPNGWWVGHDPATHQLTVHVVPAPSANGRAMRRADGLTGVPRVRFVRRLCGRPRHAESP